MRKLRKIFLLFTLLVTAVASDQHIHDQLCTGFLPKNNLKVPINKNKSLKNEGGLSKEITDKVINVVSKIYSPIILNRHNSELKISNNWTNDGVNAFASRPSSNIYAVEIWGGLARHKEMTVDGLVTVLCHEIGHHIGGAPLYQRRWASNEGQSDYWATTKCAKRIFSEFDNVKLLKSRFSKFKNKKLSKRRRIKNFVSEYAASACNNVYENIDERALCLRSAMGGFATARLLADARRVDYPKFDTPSQQVVSRTISTHPEPQCRLDTYLRGALCDLSMDDLVSNEDANVNVCNRFKTNNGNQAGVRALCWFKPSEHD